MEGLDLNIRVDLRHFALEVAVAVAPGQTLAVVGPSGAGKSSLLRAIAGAVRPQSGHICLGEATLFDAARRIDLPPERRGVGYVFQEYALFPHLSVLANVAFAAPRTRAREALASLGIAHLADARPRTLSGGERQRVALARAVASRPALLVLDEPLAALDAHTRSRVRDHLRGVVANLGLPTILVTHDIDDAAALADRVAVLVEGRLRQIAPTAELIEHPADPFVARLVGSNLLDGIARPLGEGRSEVVTSEGLTLVATGLARGGVQVVIHPWHVQIAEHAIEAGRNRLRAPVDGIVTCGGRRRVRVGPLVADLPASAPPPPLGQLAEVSFAIDHTRIIAAVA